MTTHKDAVILFQKMYPKADVKKFDFGINSRNGKVTKLDVYFQSGSTYESYININNSKFKNNQQYTKNLYDGIKFPLIRKGGGSQPKLLLTEHIKAPIDGLKPKNYTRHHFPPVVINYKVNNFKVYVNGKDWFMAQFPEMYKIYEQGTYTRSKGFHRSRTFQKQKQDYRATTWSLAPKYDYYQQLTASYLQVRC